MFWLLSVGCNWNLVISYLIIGVGRYVINILSVFIRIMESSIIYVIVNYFCYSLNEIRLYIYFIIENMSIFCILCEFFLVKRCIWNVFIYVYLGKYKIIINIIYKKRRKNYVVDDYWIFIYFLVIRISFLYWWWYYLYFFCYCSDCVDCKICEMNLDIKGFFLGKGFLCGEIIKIRCILI